MTDQFSAADMATAAVQGFRDGVASLAASAGELTPAHIKAMERAWQWMENQADGQSKGGHATFDLMMLRDERDALRAAIDVAAPPTAQAEGWISVQDELPKCSKKPDSFGVEVLIWPPHEDGSRTAFYGRRQSREPNFYKYGALLGHVEFWRYPPLPPTSAEGVEHG